MGFADSRYTFDHIAAQMICLEIGGGPTNVKNADLNRMYWAQKEFDPKSPTAKAVLRVLDTLSRVFEEKTPELERYNVVALYCVVSELLRQYVIGDVQEKLNEWFLAFEERRREEEEKPEDEADPEWVTYKEKISHSTDAAESIRWRMEFILRNLLEAHPAIRRKDNQRDFTYSQKLAVFRRDKGFCHVKVKCKGAKLTWDDWHCDHISPWSKGGLTTVKHGQAACSSCNLAKGGRE